VFFCFCFVMCCLIVMFDYPNMHITGTSSSTRCLRKAGHASRRRERIQRMEEEGVVAPRRRGDKGRHANVEPQPELEHEAMEVQ